MSHLTPILTLSQSTKATVAWTMKQLQAHGFQVERTFDLRAARMAHANCPCPHHGTNDCTCQMVVLLVQGNELQPVTIIAHGNDDHTSLSLVDMENRSIGAKVVQALIPVMENSAI
jgi:hypothetical protein